jgi:hypothetical protein
MNYTIFILYPIEIGKLSLTFERSANHTHQDDRKNLLLPLGKEILLKDRKYLRK